MFLKQHSSDLRWLYLLLLEIDLFLEKKNNTSVLPSEIFLLYMNLVSQIFLQIQRENNYLFCLELIYPTCFWCFPSFFLLKLYFMCSPCFLEILKFTFLADSFISPLNMLKPFLLKKRRSHFYFKRLFLLKIPFCTPTIELPFFWFSAYFLKIAGVSNSHCSCRH